MKKHANVIVRWVVEAECWECGRMARHTVSDAMAITLADMRQIAKELAVQRLQRTECVCTLTEKPS